VANEAFSLKSASVYTVGRVRNHYVWQGGQTENQGGQTKIFSALRAEFCPPWPETLPAPLVLFLFAFLSD